MEAEPRDYQDVIDDALQLVYSHHHRLVSQLFPSAFQPLTREQLRAARAMLKIEQSELAELSGVSVETIKRLEPAPMSENR